jgi:hypothetical protein
MRSKYHALSGKFGRLAIIRRAANSLNNMVQYVCWCDCGRMTTVRGSHLARGESKSCGCLKREVGEITRITSTTHGHSRSGKYGESSPTYESWSSMKYRCHSAKHPSHHRYGGRGITVCERWHKFENFLQDMGERPEGMEIGRKDNDGGYFKGNCRWETPAQNSRNTSKNLILTFDGKSMCLTEWSEVCGIGTTTIKQRLLRGWSIQKSLTQPVQYQRRTA